MELGPTLLLGLIAGGTILIGMPVALTFIAINIVGPITYFTRGRKAPLGA